MFGYGWLLLSNLRRTKKSSEWAYKKNKKHVMVTERFLSEVVEEYGEHPVSSDGCIWYPHQACRSLKLNHHLHSSYDKSLIIERTAVY